MCRLADFHPSRFTLIVWWGFFWRTSLFTIILMAAEGFLYNVIVSAWAAHGFASLVKLLLWKEQHPASMFMLTQVSTAVLAVLPGMMLAWYMMLTAPVYRTYTLRHIRDGRVSHGACGAVKLGWSLFWRLSVNCLPLYAALFCLHAYEIHLASTTLADVPHYALLSSILMIPTLYLYPLTLHHLLKDIHKNWSLQARPHTHAELLEAFVPGVLAEDASSDKKARRHLN